ncbi:MAG: M14 family zinc carboxypeptidase [Bacteroidota bacterium]
MSDDDVFAGVFTAQEAQQAPPPPACPGGRIVTVQRGDTLWSLARRYGTTVAAVRTANPQITDPNRLQIGQRICIPRAGAAPPPVPPGGRTYVVQPGDTMWSIARRFGVSLDALIAANPQIPNPNRLQPGQVVRIPGAAPAPPPTPPPTPAPPPTPPPGTTDGLPADLSTPPSPAYDHAMMMGELRALAARYPFLHLTTIGSSVLGRSLAAIRFGQGPHRIHLNGAHHAREWITSPLLVRFSAAFARAYERGGPVGGISARTIFNNSTFWIVPMVNPDGVEIVQHGVRSDNPFYQLLIRANGGSTNFRRWKANIRGVDLNRNYPAYWDRARAIGPQAPAPEDYAGTAPLSEPESAAIANLTRTQSFRLVAAYHSSGEVIYWNFLNLAPPESQRIVREMAARSGYTPIGVSPPESLYGGYKDWFILEFRRPGFTVEVGRGPSPVPVSQFPNIYFQNIPMLAYLGVAF